MTAVPAPVNPTIWSGAVFVIVKVPAPVIGPPVTLMPVLPLALTEYTVPAPALTHTVS